MGKEWKMLCKNEEDLTLARQLPFVPLKEVKELIHKKVNWHKAECRGFQDCSICLFLKELNKEIEELKQRGKE